MRTQPIAVHAGEGGPVLHPFAAALPGSDEAVLYVTASGICNTDLEICRGYKGFRGVLGHEFVAVTGDGVRVVGEINVACGACALCTRGLVRHCVNRRTVGMNRHDGAFAPALNLARRNLHRVPDAVFDRAAVFTEPLAAALQIAEDRLVGPGDRVVVLGAGKLGLLIAQAVARLGADAVVIARRARARALLDRWGIAQAEAGEIAPGWADAVVECTGTPGGFAQAVGWLRPRGTLILKSTYASGDGGEAGLAGAMTRVVVDELRVFGSRCGPFETALDWLARGLIETEPLIDAVYPLAEAERAFTHAAQPGALKILFDHGGQREPEG
jgi:threonine dehydrogenase-like Zn-dependent dehydrogenase